MERKQLEGSKLLVHLVTRLLITTVVVFGFGVGTSACALATGEKNGPGAGSKEAGSGPYDQSFTLAGSVGSPFFQPMNDAPFITICQSSKPCEDSSACSAAAEAIERLTKERIWLNERYFADERVRQEERQRAAQERALKAERRDRREKERSLDDELDWMQAQPDAVALLGKKLTQLENEGTRLIAAIDAVTRELERLADEQSKEELAARSYEESKAQTKAFLASLQRPVPTKWAEQIRLLETELRVGDERDQLNATSIAQRTQERQTKQENYDRKLLQLVNQLETLEDAWMWTERAQDIAQEQAAALKEIETALHNAKKEGYRLLEQATQRAIGRIEAVANQKAEEVQREEGRAMEEVRATAAEAHQRIKDTMEAMISQNERISFHAEKEGPRAVMQIEGPNAPERYEFDIQAAAKLIKQANGSVAVYDELDNQLGVIAKPWARDSKGKDVPTRLETRGSVLIQVVEHRGGGFAYPIVADPFWEQARNLWRKAKKSAKAAKRAAWGAAKCGASLWLAVSPATKAVKGAKFIKEVGGVKELVVLMRAGTKNDFLRWGRKIGYQGAKEILGIASVEKYCFGK